MFRAALALVIVLSLALPAGAQTPDFTGQVEVPRDVEFQVARVRRLLEQLDTPVPRRPTTPASFKDQLEFLSDLGGFTILIDSVEFRKIGIKNVEERELKDLSDLTTYRDALRRVVKQVPSATIVFRREHLEITTRAAKWRELLERCIWLAAFGVPIVRGTTDPRMVEGFCNHALSLKLFLLD